MRLDHYKLWRVMSIAAFLLIGITVAFAVPDKAFSTDENSSLQERHAWFTYGYKECTGTEHPQTKVTAYSTDGSYEEFPRNYIVNMKSCDTDHVLHVGGDGVTNENVSFESLNPTVLDVDSNGKVSIKNEGTAKIKATIAADDTYATCALILNVKVDKHAAWSSNDLHAYYENQPSGWGLDLTTSDEPHQIAMLLRPGAKCTSVFSSDMSVAYVDKNGLVTPVSAGQATISIETDDGGGKYTPCAFGTNITVTGEAKLKDQEITGTLGPFEIEDYRDGLQLNLQSEAGMALEYSSIGSDSKYVSVDQNGFVTFTQSATGMIHVVAPPNETYKPAEVDIRVTALDPQSQPVRRNVTVSYGCTECDETVRPCTEEGVSRLGTGATECFLIKMMMCDTDHVIRVTADGLSGENVALTSENPDILEIDSSGNVTLNNTGDVSIKGTIPGDETYAARTVKISVTVDRHDAYYTDGKFHYVGRGEDTGLFINTADGPQQMAVPLRPGASVTSFTSDNPAIASIDQNGVVTPVSPGYTVVNLTFDDGNGKYKQRTTPKRLGITVKGEDTRAEQKITGNLGPFTVDWRTGLTLDLSAQTDIQYSVSGTGSPYVDENGVVTFRGEGTATVKAVAVQSVEYQPAEVSISITAKDYAKEEAAKEAARNAAIKKEIAIAKALKKPTFKVKAKKGRKNKLTWSKVANADGYIVYVRYPGTKKYVAAITKSANVKSVVHKGLSKRKVYRYKVRAFKRVNGVTYYGPYSKARKVKAK